MDVDHRRVVSADDAAGVGDVAEEYVEEDDEGLILEGVVDGVDAGRCTEDERRGVDYEASLEGRSR